MVDLDETRTGEMIGGRYLIGALLGRGGHGEVYRARDTIDQRDAAIKFLAHHLAQDNDYRLRLVREARAMSALEGLSTIEIFGVVGADDGTPCVVMELLEGFDLAEAITERHAKNNPFSLEEIASLFEPITVTLEAAHHMNIVHRDVKPSNIFLVKGCVEDSRIMDFGLAKTGDLASITADQVLAGSPSYIAPEIWKRGAKEADARSDVYSMAVVIYEALTFEVPVYRERLVDMLVAATTPGNRGSLREKRPSLPKDIDDWADQALAIRPEDRFQTIVGMWRAFRSVVGV